MKQIILTLASLALIAAPMFGQDVPSDEPNHHYGTSGATKAFVMPKGYVPLSLSFKCPNVLAPEKSDGMVVDVTPNDLGDVRPYPCAEAPYHLKTERELNELWLQGEDMKRKQLKADSERLREEAKAKAVKIAADQAELDKITPVCHGIFRLTINKKVSDLTVKETELVKSCQHLNLYE